MERTKAAFATHMQENMPKACEPHANNMQAHLAANGIASLGRLVNLADDVAGMRATLKKATSGLTRPACQIET